MAVTELWQGIRDNLRIVKSEAGYRGWLDNRGAAWILQRVVNKGRGMNEERALVGGDRSLDKARELYLDLLKKCVTRYIFPELVKPLTWTAAAGPRRSLYHLLERLLARYGVSLMMQTDYRPAVREHGHDWPSEADTMIGLKRLDNLHACIVNVLRDGVLGDLIETGVWRGGATIFMRGALKAYGDVSRTVWVADSFQGVPRPNALAFPRDRGDTLWSQSELAVSLDTVKANFAKYGLLDDQVKFLAGWFRDTLATAPIQRLAVMRLDGDLYESTMDALRFLYPKLSVGGYAIIDDYGSMPPCKQAVDEFRLTAGIRDALQPVDYDAVFWRRTR
jgi:O-methyltransferase